MYMRQAIIAAVGLSCLAEGVIAAGAEKRQDKVTLTKYVTKRKSRTSSEAEAATEDITTVVPTSYVTDGTTIWVEETITIPCSASACTATQSTDASADAETGSLTELTADLTTVVPTSYVTDGTTIYVDETITIPCTKCAASETTGASADAETTEEAETSASETTDGGNVTEQTADITTVVPTSYVTDGTTIYVDETITIPCTKCEATETDATTADSDSTAVVPTGSAASETDSFASTALGEETTSEAGETGTRTAGTASDDVESSTEAASTFSTNILSTGYGGSSATTQSGLFPNTTIATGFETSTGEEVTGTATGAGSTVTTDADQEPTGTTVSTGFSSGFFGNSSTIAVTTKVDTTGDVKTTGTAVVTKINKPVIIVIRQVTIFHRTVVIGAACPPVKRSNNDGAYVVGEGSDEKSFTEIGEALTDACNTQFKACSNNAGQNFAVSDCQDQLKTCLSDASSQAEEEPSVTQKESTDTASIILPPDATITGESKSYIGNGNTVISTRTLTVSESCVISDGTPVITGPTETGETVAETTAVVESTGSTALGGASSEATEDVTTVVTGTLTNVVEETVTLPATGTESTGIVTVITMTNGEETSLVSLTLTTGVATGSGTVSIPYGGSDETTVVEPPTPEETTESSAIGQDTTQVPTGTDGIVTVTVVGTEGVTKTVTEQVTETETITERCDGNASANGSQTAATVTETITSVESCLAPTTLATQTTPTRSAETVYVTETIEFARQQTAAPESKERLRRMLGFAW